MANVGVELKTFTLLARNQQFITWNVRADHGSYFVTTYNKGKLTLKKRQPERKKGKKETGLIVKK